MSGAGDGGVPFGIWVGGDVRGVRLRTSRFATSSTTRNIRAPFGQLAGPAILMWNHSTGSVVDGNTFINCHREISLGLIQRTPDDHVGGIVRNNFVYRTASARGDAAILVADSPGTQVLHNSILVSGNLRECR